MRICVVKHPTDTTPSEIKGDNMGVRKGVLYIFENKIIEIPVKTEVAMKEHKKYCEEEDCEECAMIDDRTPCEQFEPLAVFAAGTWTSCVVKEECD